jgi:signal peptidase
LRFDLRRPVREIGPPNRLSSEENMLISTLRMMRSALRLAWVAIAIGLVGVALLPHVITAVHRDMYIVRGASMQPSIPLGAVIIVEPVDPATVAVGDVITFRASNDTVVTHRVVALPVADSTEFATKGDASTSDDPIPVPASALIGRVDMVLPGLGILLTLLASTVGTVAALSLVGGLLLAIKFMDELLATLRRASQRGAVVTEPAR